MTEDAQGNKKPDKRKATGRIDGIVTLIMAVGVESAKPAQAPKYSLHFV
jgi:hypothetical protein